MSAIGRHRLYQQRLTHSAWRSAEAVVGWLGALQGQDYAGAQWSFGLRWPASTLADIERAIAGGTIRRTWALRGTLHYVAAADLHWLVGLVGPRLIAGNARRYRELELDEATLRRGTELIALVLRDGQQRSRDELFGHLEAAGIATTGQRGVYLLQRAALERLVYQGAPRGNVTTFRTLEPGPTLPRAEALAELARRYFTSHGPATLADFVSWSGLPTAEARAGLASVADVLLKVERDGQPYWQAPEPPAEPEQAVYLLPGFDEYILGYRDRSAVLEPRFAAAICPGGNGMFRPTIVSAGRVIGTWQRALKRERVEITLQPFRPLTADERTAVAVAVARYGAFLGRRPVISGEAPGASHAAAMATS